jgi:putative ABC transport system permease protein
VSDARNLGINRDPLPQLYEPQAQTPDAVSRQVSRQYPLAWVVRTRTPQPGLRKSILTALRQATGVPVSSISAMDQVLHLSTSRWRFGMWLMTIFGAGALLLAATGVYALMAYTVVQRAPEIAIRLALGAERANVRNMVVWQGMRLVLGGVAVGILAALGLSRLIAVFLYGVQAWDPLVFVSVPLVLGAVALLAVWWPARRASRVDPLVAIRSE